MKNKQEATMAFEKDCQKNCKLLQKVKRKSKINETRANRNA